MWAVLRAWSLGRRPLRWGSPSRNHSESASGCHALKGNSMRVKARLTQRIRPSRRPKPGISSNGVGWALRRPPLPPGHDAPRSRLLSLPLPRRRQQRPPAALQPTPSIRLHSLLCLLRLSATALSRGPPRPAPRQPGSNSHRIEPTLQPVCASGAARRQYRAQQHSIARPLAATRSVDLAARGWLFAVR